MHRTLRAVAALLALALALALAACGGGHKTHPSPPARTTTTTAPVPAPTPSALTNCRTVPMAGKFVARPIPHTAKAQATAKLAFRQGAYCPNATRAPPGVKLRIVKGSATVTQFDSTELDTIPSSARYVAGYIDGCCQSYGPIYNAFHPRGATTVGITVFGGEARVFDSEPGNPTPPAAASWAYREIHSNSPNKRPVVYTMGSWWSWMSQALAGAGVPHCSSSTQQNCYLIWIADWTYSPFILAGSDGTQWTDRYGNSNLDASVMGTWVYSNPAPPPPPSMHYERYGNTTISSPWGASRRQEFAWVYNYDWARPYYPRAYKQATINIQTKLRWWANQLAYRIHHSSASVNAANWRYQRFGEMTARYRGKVCTKNGWATCVYG